MKKGVVLASALVFLLIPSVLFAQGTCTSKVLCKETLEMSDEQCSKLMNLRTEHQMASIKLGAELEILKLKMCQELSKDDPSATELESLASKMGATRADLHKKWIDNLLQAKKILEPEQWKTFRRCFGDMGNPCSTGMGCMVIDGCNVEGGSPTRMILSGAGQCSSVKCISMDKNCTSMRCGNMTCGSSCCEVVKSEMEDCKPGNSSCEEIERRCIQIQTGQ